MGDYLSPAQMDARDRAYDLRCVRTARPRGPGECSQCLGWARARFPILINCLYRVTVDYCCARCAMEPPPADLHRHYCAVVSRSEAERILAPEG
jgi:hypothetical protein